MSVTSKSKLVGRVLGGLMVIGLLQFDFDAAHAQGPETVTLEQLREELAERDAIIIELLDRVRALEDDRGDAREAPPVSQSGPRSESTSATADITQDEGESLVVDELLAERALERGLVMEGTRLLTPRQIEFTPSFNLSREEGMFPIALMVGDETAVGEVERTIDVNLRKADLRFGLPRQLQLEIGVPYQVVDQEIETAIGGTVQSANHQTGSGFGDLTVGLAKVLADEKERRPNLIGRLIWLTGSGDERDDRVFLGGGHAAVRAQLGASWRRDPVVFLMSGGYTHFEEDGTLQPGDSYDLSLGLGLAVSPDTALIFSLNQTSLDEFRRDEIKLPGTDRLSSTLGLSASTIVGRRLLLQVNTNVGLTEDASDYQFGLALSSRFDSR
jgi:hypothetical protein